jgi:hypothetical protein
MTQNCVVRSELNHYYVTVSHDPELGHMYNTKFGLFHVRKQAFMVGLL